ncbi:MAG: DNA methyltransferase, partial [Candidatus Methanoperedens sp.]
YRGNWSPYIPRNLILRYTAPEDMVLDKMIGSGTTLVECKLLGRRAVGVDINLGAVILYTR